ncbi:MAG TPA: hypothetical protein PK280_13830 [Planctomycetota bacterium]|nr:hypothetical protein [Planctomycetota bacterium]
MGEGGVAGCANGAAGCRAGDGDGTLGAVGATGGMAGAAAGSLTGFGAAGCRGLAAAVWPPLGAEGPHAGHRAATESADVVKSPRRIPMKPLPAWLDERAWIIEHPEALARN